MALIPGNESYTVVFCTAPPDLAASMSEILVRERLAACINRLPVESSYIWDEDLCNDKETLMIIKTTTHALPALRKRICEIHSYEVPEIIAIPVIFGTEGYLGWVRENTSIPE